jgi:hypothetical protein
MRIRLPILLSAALLAAAILMASATNFTRTDLTASTGWPNT